jgi:sporulation protein YlmC with PRC-barrel domain
MQRDILTAVSRHLTPDLMAKMASASGISDRAITEKAVGAAVPAVLSRLATLATKPEGERQLTDAVAKQSPRTMESFATIGGPVQLSDAGKSLLSSLLGAGSFSSLASGIGRFAGVGDGAARSILGMLTPVILSVLGREARGEVNGLTQLLASQRDDFAAAMPAGLSDLLRTGGDRIGSVTSAARHANEHRGTQNSTARMVHAVGPTQSRSSSHWVYWALPFLALAGLAWYFWGDERAGGPVAEAPPQPKVAPQSTVQRPVSSTDLQAQITAAIDSLNGTLQAVKDRPSDASVLPRLQQAADELDRLHSLAGRLPFETRDRLAEAIKTAIAQARTALDGVNAMPGLAAEGRPVIASLRTKLDALVMTPASLAQQRASTSADKTTYLQRASGDAVALSAYFDRDVYNSAGERIGTVSDLIAGPDGRIAAVVIGVGGFLGIGEKEVAVPFSSMQIVRRDNDWHLAIEGTRDALRNAPPYEDTGARVRLSPTPRTTQK